MSYCFVGSQYHFPSTAVSLGHQNDGAGKLWTAVANTQHGLVGGKAKGDTCWYSYDGREHTTKDFSWLTAPEGRVVTVRNMGSTPPGAVCFGLQSDNKEYYAALAKCHQGLIPGKARGNTCWYPHGGKEHITSDFFWLVAA